MTARLESGGLVDGQYVLIEPLGSGATGTVWSARDTTQPEETVVALKILHRQLRDEPKVVDQMVREHHVLRQLDLGDFVGKCVARHHQPRTIPGFVIPQLSVLAGRIVTQIKIVVEFLQSTLVLPTRTIQQTRIAQIGEFLRIPRPQKRMIYNHDTPPVSASLVGRPGPPHLSSGRS